MIGSTDVCIGFLDKFIESGYVSFPTNGRVLEVGCAEGDMIGPLKIARPDLHVTGIDWRAVDRPKADKLVRGDVLLYNFPPQSFDCVIAVSTLEHVGLGSYERDPIDPDGDTKTLRRMAEWVKPDGWIYFDVPFRPDGPYVVKKNFRAYDQEHLKERLTLAVDGWRPVVSMTFTTDHPDGPYVAVKMTKRP